SRFCRPIASRPGSSSSSGASRADKEGPMTLDERRSRIVLLVDDQPIVAESVRGMLADAPDITFHYCQDPAAAVAPAAEIAPAVILQDLVMPGIDGFALLSQYRASDRLRAVPVIVLSAKEDPVVKSETFARGANDYVVKVPDRLELVARIRMHSDAFLDHLE